VARSTPPPGADHGQVLAGLDDADARRVAPLGRIAIAADQANMDP
jgi:hypothetical protein